MIAVKLTRREAETVADCLDKSGKSGYVALVAELLQGALEDEASGEATEVEAERPPPF
jgi:hypothetical protein